MGGSYALKRRAVCSMWSEYTTSKANFSLDFFKDLLKRSVTLHSYPQNQPTKEQIKDWLENDFKDVIDSSFFQSTINLLVLLKRVPNITNITYQTNLNYDLDKSPFVDLLNFYDSLSEDIKDLFVRNIHMIILEVLKTDDYELPFN